MKKTIIAIIFSFAFVNSASAVEITAKDCAALKVYAFSVMNLVNTTNDYLQISGPNILLISINSINDPATISALAEINEAASKIAPATDVISVALKGLIPLVESCQG